MIRLFIYPDAPPLLHGFERGGPYEDCIPFSRLGIERHCELVEPKDAQLFYGGSYHDNFAFLLETPERFEHFVGNVRQHVFDIEGDWPNRPIPEWLRDSPISAVNIPLEWFLDSSTRFRNAMSRPTFSRLFVKLARYQAADFIPPIGRVLGFRGQRDPFGYREKVGLALENAPVLADYSFTEGWNGPTATEDQIVVAYRQFILDHTFSICPAGAGQTTARFFETCYFGRIPIVINDRRLFASEDYDTSFAFHLPLDLTVDQLKGQIVGITRICDAEIIERCQAARAYFDGPVREYMTDPTAYFVKFMKKRG
ncbi:MAG: hypothetical protein Q7O66_08620, partial [Dehalococcoidia bacterium]|nr:hypothetical protein [Dehalococcoidia bacterium]